MANTSFIPKPLSHPLYLTERQVEEIRKGNYYFQAGKLIEKSTGKIIAQF